MKIKTEDNDVESNSTEPEAATTNDNSIVNLLSSSPVVEIEVAVEVLSEDKTDNFCNICSKSFSSYVMFEKHIKRHLGI